MCDIADFQIFSIISREKAPMNIHSVAQKFSIRLTRIVLSHPRPSAFALQTDLFEKQKSMHYDPWKVKMYVPPNFLPFLY